MIRRAFLTKPRLAIAVATQFWLAAPLLDNGWQAAFEPGRSLTYRLTGSALAWFHQLIGHDEVKTFGLPPRWSPAYETILRERYGVTQTAVAGCVVSPDEIHFVGGYNSVSRRMIKLKHGKDIFQECADEAQEIYSRKGSQ